MNMNNSILEKTHITQYDLNNLVTMNPFDPQKIEAEASTLIYYNQKPLLEELPKLQSESSVRRKGTTVVFLGDGEFITDGSIITSVEDLKKKGRVVENLVLAETEISAELLHNLLVTLKPDLKALYIFRVPLDYEHIEKLNELDLGLEFLSLGYVETDQSNPFKKEQQKEKAYKPFDINKLNFKGLGPCLKFLQLQGITLKTETVDVLAKTYSDSIEILLLEGLKSSEQSKQELVQHILGVLSTFNNLKGLSLAKNSLASIKFNEADSEEEQEENRESQSNQSIKFPSTLMALNLNACNLDNKQVHDLVGKLEEAKCPLKALHLEGSRLYSRTLEAVSKFGQSCNNNGGFLLEMSKPPIDPSGRNVFKDPKSKIQNIQTKITEVFSELLENSTILETLKTSETRPEWISQLSKRQDFIQLLPYLLKLLRQIKFFDDAYQYNKVDLRTNAKVLIPKHDFNELLNKIANDSNGTLDLGDTIVGQFDHNLIRHVHPTLLRDDDWAKLPLKNQRDNFLALMKKLGYNHIEKKHKDCFEDQFVMAVKISRRVSYDYTLATFSLFWYYNQVSVKFNLSDDWYLNRKQRFNRYAPPNQDFLISFCGEWNTHANDFVFELDIKDDGEPEIKFKSSIWKDGDLNVARALLIAIDRGFVMLKALYKMELFDKGDVFQGVEDSKKVRKILKEKLRKYAKSQDFENLRKQEIAILGEPELEEEAVEEEQQ